MKLSFYRDSQKTTKSLFLVLIIPLQSKENLFKARTVFVSPPTGFKCESSVVIPLCMLWGVLCS